MALSQRKRQKSIERRNAKQKTRKRALVTQQRTESNSFMQRYASLPVLHCQIGTSLIESGIGNVTLSRGRLGEDIAYAIFLVDMYCLGVKNVLFGVDTWNTYLERVVHGPFARHEAIEQTPAAVRKLVEGAVDYAGKLGLPPHMDYFKARGLFGDIDVAECMEEFTYGKDGKPFFVAGPYDTHAYCTRVTSLLTAKCGVGNFDCLLPADMGDGPIVHLPDGSILHLPNFDDWDFDEDEDDDEYY